MKRNYYGLKHGQRLGYDLGRHESYFFYIYEDGSNSVMIRTKEGRAYIFGNIEYCRRMFRAGYCFQQFRNGKKQDIILKGFKNALTA